MSTRHRQVLILIAVLISLSLLAAPARSADFFGIHVGSDGFGVTFGSSDWWVYGATWSDPGWQGSYDSALAGYGEWIRVDGLGRCWRPYVQTRWQPYTYGRWVYTSLGWTWVAYEPWGYFPHHYGTWALATVGWVWVPGYEYHAANVVWVQTSAYVGWYPRGPRGWSHASHAFERGYQRGYNRGYNNGYDDGWRDAEYATCVEWRHLGDADVARYAVGRGAVLSPRSRPQLRVSEQGPSRLDVSRRGGVSIPEANLSRRTVRVDGRTVTAMRPDGMDASVRRYAPGAAESALAPRVREQIRQRAMDRQAPAARVREAAPSPRRDLRSETSTSRRAQPAEPAAPRGGLVRGAPASPRAAAPGPAATVRSPRPAPTTNSSRRLPSTRADREPASRPRTSSGDQRAVPARPAAPPSASSRAGSRPVPAPRVQTSRREAPTAPARSGGSGQRSTTTRQAPAERQGDTAQAQRTDSDRGKPQSRSSEKDRRHRR